MDRPNTIQLPVQDYPKPPLCPILVEEGVVAVQMFPAQERVGTILLTDTGKAQLQPDAGVVIASGEEGIYVGDTVLVIPDHGTWYENFLGEDRNVRLYGIESYSPTCVIKEGASMSIPAKIDGSIKCLRDWVLLRRDPVVKTSSFIELPDDEQYRNGMATVVSAGPKSGFNEGDRVLYDSRAVSYDTEFLDRPEYAHIVGDADAKDFVFIRSTAIYGQARVA